MHGWTDDMKNSTLLLLTYPFIFSILLKYSVGLERSETFNETKCCNLCYMKLVLVELKIFVTCREGFILNTLTITPFMGKCRSRYTVCHNVIKLPCNKSSNIGRKTCHLYWKSCREKAWTFFSRKFLHSRKFFTFKRLSSYGSKSEKAK